MERPIQKGCMVQDHTEEQICMICIDLDCTLKSRTLCEECLKDYQNDHQHCLDFLKFEDFKSFQLKFGNKPENDIQNIFNDILNYESQICQQIEEKYDGLLNSILFSIEKAKKKHKLQMLSQYENLKNKIKEYLENQNKFTDLSDLQQEINKFVEGRIGISELNGKLEEKQKQNQEKDVQFTLLEKYNQVEQQLLQEHQVQNLIKKVQEEIEIASLFNSQIYLPDYCQYFKKISPRFKPFEGFRQYVQENKSKNNIYQVSSNSNFRSQYKFKRNELYYLKFKLYLKQNEEYTNTNNNKGETQKLDTTINLD